MLLSHTHSPHPVPSGTYGLYHKSTITKTRRTSVVPCSISSVQNELELRRKDRKSQSRKIEGSCKGRHLLRCTKQTPNLCESPKDCPDRKQIRILECVLTYFSDTILFKAGIKTQFKHRVQLYIFLQLTWIP